MIKKKQSLLESRWSRELIVQLEMVENLENGGDVFVNHCRSHRRILTNLINKNQQKQISSDLLNFINEINLIKCREDNNADKRGMISGF